MTTLTGAIPTGLVTEAAQMAVLMGAQSGKAPQGPIEMVIFEGGEFHQVRVLAPMGPVCGLLIDQRAPRCWIQGVLRPLSVMEHKLLLMLLSACPKAVVIADIAAQLHPGAPNPDYVVYGAVERLRQALGDPEWVVNSVGGYYQLNLM
jgi:hypothetical protein